MKIEDIKDMDKLKLIWSSLNFVFRLIFGLIALTFEFWTQGFNELVTAATKKILGFLCVVGVFAAAIFILGHKTHGPPFDLTFSELVLYFFLFFTAATVIFLIFRIEEHARDISKIEKNTNPSKQSKNTNNPDDLRKAFGNILIKKKENEGQRLSYDINGLKRVITVDYVASVRFGENRWDSYASLHNPLGVFFISGTVSFVWSENREASDVGSLRLRIPKTSEFDTYGKETSIEINCTAEMFAYISDKLLKNNLSHMDFAGLLKLNSIRRDEYYKNSPSFGCDVSIEEIIMSKDYSYYFSHVYYEKNMGYFFNKFDEYGLPNHILEMQSRLESLSNGSANRKGMDKNYPVEREIEVIKNQLEISEKFETHGLSDYDEILDETDEADE